MKAGIGQRGGKGVNESDLDKTSRPRSEAVEPREQRDSVILCQTKSLSLSPRGFLCLRRLLSLPPFSFTYFYLFLFAPIRVITRPFSPPPPSPPTPSFFVSLLHRPLSPDFKLRGNFNSNIPRFIDNLTGYI